MSIPMVNLQRQYARLKDEILSAVHASLDACHYIFGPNVQAFEEEAANYCGSKHALAVASGTDALQLALRAVGIGAGDEVITTAFTFIGTSEAISYTGAKPVFVDIDPSTFNIDITKIAAAVTAKTRAVIVVHVFGQPVDMDPLLEMCRKKNLKVIEDCAHAFGADYHGKKVGTFGDAGCFSFYPSKNLGAFGDAGMVLTQNEHIAKTIKILRNHGSEKAPQHILIGYNSRLDDIQAAILRTKLKHIDVFNTARRSNAELYTHLLQHEAITTPKEDGIGRHIYHQYTIRVKNRDAVINALQQAGIAYGIHYASPLHKQPVYEKDYAELSLPHAEKATEEVLCLPMCPEIHDLEIRSVCKTVLASL
jgi:dTDP-4-amino-4,6-dideoxygalactose transaminase